MSHRQAGRRGSGRPGGTHSPCRGFAAGPAFLASSSFSCPAKDYQAPMWLSAAGEGVLLLVMAFRTDKTPRRNGADGAAEQPRGLSTIAATLGTPSHEPGVPTYVVVPCGPRRVELRVQLPLLPRQLVVLRLLLPRQRVPLQGGGKKHGVNPGAVHPAPRTRGPTRPSHLMATGVPTTSPGPLPRASGAPG